jgi:hypothetical protein
MVGMYAPVKLRHLLVRNCPCRTGTSHRGRSPLPREHKANRDRNAQLLRGDATLACAEKREPVTEKQN